MLVVAGGAIPPNDYPLLKRAGVAGIYDPRTDIPAAAAELLGIIRDSRKAA